MAFPISPEGRFLVPDHIVRETDGVYVLIDRERANWICLNRSGMEIFRLLPGKTFAEAAAGCADAGIVSAGESESLLRRFTADLARKEFLSTEPITGELVARAGILAPERLHEVWVVTNFECNMACRHCYTYERVARDRRRIGKDALLAMMDECRELGAEVFYLTGGEPLLRGDLDDLIEAATRRSRAILFTNGTLVTPERASLLSRFRDRLAVQVSLEGPDEESNSSLRGKGSFAKAMEGIRNLLREGIRVGVSSTPTPQTARRIPELTRLLAGTFEGRHGVDFHHIIYVVHAGNAREGDTAKLAASELIDVVIRCKEAVRKAKKEGARTRLKITNDKIFEAIASNGPRKDMCGAGYTILGINADGMLHPCATTMHDTAYNLGYLLNERGDYLPEEIGRLWREGAAAQRIRSFTVFPRDGGKVTDLRNFHGGGCWYHMGDPEGDISTEHPFYTAYESLTEKAILHMATKDIPEGDRFREAPRPRICSSMSRTRIACAGVRKTRDESTLGIDNGYCICFA